MVGRQAPDLSCNGAKPAYATRTPGRDQDRDGFPDRENNQVMHNSNRNASGLYAHRAYKFFLGLGFLSPVEVIYIYIFEMPCDQEA